MAQRRFWRRKDTEKMGQIESQIFGISYVAKGDSGDDTPRPTEVGRCCRGVPSPGPRLMQGGLFSRLPPPGPLAHRWPLAKDVLPAASAPLGTRHRASLAVVVPNIGVLPVTNSWYSRPETSKLSIVTETKFCFCFWGSKRSRLWRSVAGTQHEVPISKVEGILQIRKK